MNNSNSSPYNDWIILLGVALILIFITYGLIRLVCKIYRLIHRRKDTVHMVDMSNVVILNTKRKSVIG